MCSIIQPWNTLDKYTRLKHRSPLHFSRESDCTGSQLRRLCSIHESGVIPSRCQLQLAKSISPAPSSLLVTNVYWVSLTNYPSRSMHHLQYPVLQMKCCRLPAWSTAINLLHSHEAFDRAEPAPALVPLVDTREGIWDIMIASDSRSEHPAAHTPAK
jgi:hypothetical protein